MHTRIPTNFQVGVYKEQTGKHQARKSLHKFAKKVTTTFNSEFVGFLFEGTQIHTAYKVHAKATAGHKSKVPATLAHWPKKMRINAPNNPRKPAENFH